MTETLWRERFRVLVTGGRDYDNALDVERALNMVYARHGAPIVIHGGASGADTLAAKWAERLGVPQRVHLADWRRHGRKAGPLRNQQMLDDEKPQLVLAFPGGRGTADMVRRARAAGVPVEEWS